MSQSSSAGLATLTSRWKVGPSVPASDLDGARAVLASSLALGKAPSDLDPAVPLRPVVTGTISAPAAPVTPSLGFTQSPLAISVQNPLAVPAWANGVEQGKTYGPLIDQLGLGNIVVTVPVTASKTFSYAGAASGFGVLPVSGAPASATSLTLGAGSVWFAATLLVATAPAGSFAGFRISGGTLTSTAAITLQSGAYVVPAGATLTLQATLAPPAPGTGTPGADLTGAAIALPATVTIKFSQTTATVEALGDASLTLYGTHVGITWSSPAALLVPGLPAISVVGKANVTSFAFASVKSKAFVPSGTAALAGAGWALPLATTTITTLGEASGAGSLLLALGAGAGFTAAPASAAKAAGWLVSIDPAQLFAVVSGEGTAT